MAAVGEGGGGCTEVSRERREAFSSGALHHLQTRTHPIRERGNVLCNAGDILGLWFFLHGVYGPVQV